MLLFKVSMPNKLQDPYRHKFYQDKYKISNSREYDQSLKNRGSLTIWFSEDAVAKWNNPVLKHRKRGGQAIPSTYQALTAHQNKHGNRVPIKAVVPPNLWFRAEMPDDSKLRLDNIRLMEQGRKRWQEHTDYGRRTEAENAIYRYKTIIGNKLKSRSFLNQKLKVK